MFARVKPLGWGFLEILTSGQITQLDINMANAIDGVGGGSYGGPLDLTNVQSILMAGTKTIDLNPHTVTRVIGSPPVPDDMTKWLPAAAAQGYWQTAVNTQTTLVYDFQLPDLAVVTGFDVTILGKGGHAGMPATMPNMSLYRASNSPFGGTSLIGSQTDTTATTGNYQLAHAILKSGLAPPAHDADTQYFFFYFTSEFGANALDTLKVGKPRVFFTASRIDEM